MGRRILALLAFGAFCTAEAQAEVVRLEITETRDWVPGFVSKSGEYESVTGTAFYEIDPKAADARDITDIRLAPRNARGMVEYRGPFVIIRPKDKAKANGTTLFEVANRGGDQSNYILFQAQGFTLSNPQRATQIEHAPLFDRGYTFAWAGWQSDLDEKEFGLVVPRAAVNGQVRAAAFVGSKDEPTDGGSARVGGSCAADADDPTAEMRLHRRYDDAGVIVPRSSWRFAARDKDGKVSLDRCAFLLDKPVTEPTLVTIVYRGDQPQVAGLGLAAVRDFATFLRTREIAGRTPEPTVIAYGYSQSARFLRDFLYRGFNRRSDGGRVFDGVLDVAAGAGRGSFDHRYASPGDAGNSVGSALRAVDLYPFADLPTPDITGGREEGLLDRARRDGVSPKLFHILSGTEYWARAGSLMQATPDGLRALPEAPDTRTYVFAGTNHAPGASVLFLTKEAPAAYPYNDNGDLLMALPSLLERMRLWIADGVTPPSTQRPEVGSTLVKPTDLKFPTLPGVTVPKAPPPVWQLDFGPDYRSRGILVEPPKVGPRYELLVPQVDEDGNELGGWHGLMRSLPVGTYTAWNDNDQVAAQFGMLSGLSGAFIPFPWDEADREAKTDPRRSLIARYGSREAYLRAADAEIERQITHGFLLLDERGRARDKMFANWIRADVLGYLWPKPK